MGTCQSFCGRNESMQQTLPDTESMIIRDNVSGTTTKSIYLHATHETAESTSSSRVTTPGQVTSSDIMEEFEQAIIQGSKNMVMFLADEHREFDFIHTEFKGGHTALELAVINKKYDVMEYILESGANVNATDKDGNSALHVAVSEADLRAIKVLRKFNANSFLNNKRKETPFSLAKAARNQRIVRELGGKSMDMRGFGTKTCSKGLLMPMTGNTGYVRRANKKSSSKNRLSIKQSYAADDILLMNGGPSMDASDDSDDDDFMPLRGFASGPRLTMMDTNDMRGIADDIFIDIHDTVHKHKKTLMPLEGWIEKKQSSIPYSWQRRWVICDYNYIFWSDREIHISENGVVDGKPTKTEKKRWNCSMKMANIIELSKITEGKSQRKMRMKLKGTKKEIVWKLKDQKMRNQWVNQMNKHMVVAKQESLVR